MRQLEGDELNGPFEGAVAVHGVLRTRLQEQGIVFIEETEHDVPGPTDWAAIELDDGSQYLLVHPTSDGADGYLYVRARVQALSPHDTAQPFLEWLGVAPEDILFFYEDWPPPYRGPAA